MTFFHALLWKIQEHLQKLLQDMKLEILNIAFCIYIHNWKQSDMQKWLIFLLLLFTFFSIHIKNLSEPPVLKNIDGWKKKKEPETELLKLQGIHQLGRNSVKTVF